MGYPNVQVDKTQKFRKTPIKFRRITTGLSENLLEVSSKHKSLKN